MYYAVQEEFAPATIEVSGFEDGKVNIKISARAHFPSYTLRGYTLRCGQQSVQINTLKPGESQTVTFTATADEVEISLVKPGDFVILTKTFKR
jgi:beta-glucuronidase